MWKGGRDFSGDPGMEKSRWDRVVATHTVRIRQVLAWLIFLAMTCWGTMAVVYSNLSAGLRLLQQGLLEYRRLAASFSPGKLSWKIAFFSSVFALVLAWWLALPPSNDRDWQPDVAKLSSVTHQGDSDIIHNIGTAITGARAIMLSGTMTELSILNLCALWTFFWLTGVCPILPIPCSASDLTGTNTSASHRGPEKKR